MMSFEIWVVVGIVGLISILWKLPNLWRKLLYHWQPHIVEAVDKCPGPKCFPLIGNVQAFWGTSEQIFTNLRSLAKQFQPRYKIWAFNRAVVNIITPEDAEALLGNPKELTKGFVYKFIMPWLGTGLLTSTGGKWKARRKFLTPAFHFSILKEFVKVFEKHANETVSLMEAECEKESTDIIPFITENALQAICETTMGYELDRKSTKFINYKNAIHDLGKILVHRMFRPWLYQNFIFNFTIMGFKAKTVVKELHKFTSEVIQERLLNWNKSPIQKLESASGKKRQAMLNMLVQNMKDGGEIDINGIQEEVDTLMFEGHDTVTMGITFALLLLAGHRDVQDRIVEEVREVLGDDDRDATYEDLQSMVYLEMCIKECLRVYPSVPFIARQMDQDLVLKGVTLPKGVFCNIHIYDIHHNPKYWPEPEKFDPERFSPENSIGRHPYSYVPFSAGSRNCIGQRFAILEMKSFVAKVLKKYILEPVDTPETVVIFLDLVLRPQGSVKIKFRKRM